MNKFIIIVGTISTFLWGFVTAMTFGLPEHVCQAIDKMTFQLMTHEVYQMANGFYYDVRNNDMPTIAFLIIFAIIFILVSFLTIAIERKSTQKNSLGLIIFFSVLFRLVLLPGELIHENDIYRYIWDAKSSLQGINPYKYAPADVFMFDHGYSSDYYDDYHEVTIKGKEFTGEDGENLKTLIELRNQNYVFYERIGHWQVPTIYPPVAQVLFTIPVAINGNSLVLMKFFFVLFDIAVLILIIYLLKHLKMNPCMSIVYGWSPLVCFEVANGGHYDSIVIFFTVLSLLLYVQRKKLGSFAILAVATLSKFYSAMLLPLINKPFKLRFLLAFIALVGLIYLPFFIWDHTGVNGVFQGLMTYNAKWSYNSSVFSLVYIILDNFAGDYTKTLIPSKIIVACLYLVILGSLVLKKNKNDLDVLHTCFLSVAFLFILNPVADPWYYCWLMPFLCFFPYKSWYFLSGLLMLGYLNFHSDIRIVDMKFLEFPLIGWLVYVPFYLYLIKEIIWKPSFKHLESTKGDV